MSSLTKSLEKRIQELTLSIEAQKTQLAAYERVLALESDTESAPPELAAPVAENHVHAEVTPKEAPQAAAMHSPVAAPDLSGLESARNKTDLIAAIVGKHGRTGATPKEVDAIFTQRGVPKSKNLIYNTLSYLVAHKRLVRKNGKYFELGITPGPAKKKEVAPVRTKRKISAAGLKSIRDANKKRWAAKRAADAAAAKGTTKKAAKKKSA